MKRRFLMLCAVFFITLMLLSISERFVTGVSVHNFELAEGLIKEGQYNSAEPVVYHPDRIDKNGDKIQDSLENLILQVAMSNQSALVPVVATLYNPVSDQDLNHFLMLGGQVTNVYRYVTHGFAGVIPAGNIAAFARSEGGNLAVIERDQPLRYHLDVSVPLTRVRPLVWQTYGLSGSSDQSIAIIDTGIDDSHPDVGPFGNLNFSRKIVGWHDATSDASLAPQDYGEHGSHVAGIASGSGASNNLQGTGVLQTTFTYTFPTPGYGYMDFVDVMTQGTIELNCSWRGNNNVLLRLYNPAGTTVAETSGTDKPLLLTYNTVGTSYPTGRYRVLVGNLAGPSGNPFSLIESYPYQGQTDGYNLFTGVAPDSRLVGVKVFNNAGSGTSSSVMAGMDWVIQNRLQYHIIVASMSLGLENGGVDSTLDQKVDTMVANGIVTTVSAGNDYPTYSIGSPGTAAYAITVAATNDQNGLTDYSSNGDVLKNEFGLVKPDVSAPGGTFQPQYGNKILSVDSNDVDAGYSGFADRSRNDYQPMAGTSMSTPHVAGLAALIVQAFGSWSWTQSEALKVKMIISMTAFETPSGESGNVPPLSRGGKDNREGYGRISADAAVEAATMAYTIGENVNAVFGSGPSDKKVWARQVSLSSGSKYRFDLSVPSGADYDLYLYNGNPDGYGQPVIAKKSVNASVGAGEVVEYIPSASGTYFIVVKWVSGNGAFSLQSVAVTVHDVMVVAVSASPSVVYDRETVNVTVVVKNVGTVVETFNVTAYYSSTPFETRLVTGLAAGNNLTLTLMWNTTGISSDYYVISASAGPVLGESSQADNMLDDGVVLVKKLGDVDGDGVVNIYDAIYVSYSFGASVGDSRYISGADFNGDGVIDILDAIIVSANWTG